MRGGRATQVAAGILLALTLGCGGSSDARTHAVAASPPPSFAHVVLVVFENREYDSIVGGSDAPTFNRLARRYALLTNSSGVAHPSLPNYLALVSGSTQGIDSDCTTCVVDARNLADSLADAHRSWKLYAEGLPAPGWTGAQSGRYAKKHNPFVYFEDVLSSRARLARVVPLVRFAADLRTQRLPDFALVVPDLCHDMHDCSVATGDAWLRTFLEPLLASPEMEGSVVFVTFDEGTSVESGGGHVATLALGPTVRPGARFAPATDHYGLLRTIEEAWHLPLLGESATARAVTGIWRSSR